LGRRLGQGVKEGLQEPEDGLDGFGAMGPSGSQVSSGLRKRLRAPVEARGQRLRFKEAKEAERVLACPGVSRGFPDGRLLPQDFSARGARKPTGFFSLMEFNTDARACDGRKKYIYILY
jgi:hypothetical protein